MAKIGVLFDIDGLGGGFYGAAAYRLLFDAVGRDSLRNVRLFDGDTNATLTGSDRVYCIAVEAADGRVCDAIESALAASPSPALLPQGSRFLRDGAAIRNEPLVPAGRIDARGMLSECDTPWIVTAWQAHVDAPVRATETAASEPATSAPKPGGWLAWWNKLRSHR